MASLGSRFFLQFSLYPLSLLIYTFLPPVHITRHLHLFLNLSLSPLSLSIAHFPLSITFFFIYTFSVNLDSLSLCICTTNTVRWKQIRKIVSLLYFSFSLNLSDPFLYYIFFWPALSPFLTNIVPFWRLIKRTHSASPSLYLYYPLYIPIPNKYLYEM